MRITCILILISFAYCGFAQLNHYDFNIAELSPGESYIELQHNIVKSNGPAVFYTFHDHDPKFGLTNFHSHLYFNPFGETNELVQTSSIKFQQYINKRIGGSIYLPLAIQQKTFDEQSKSNVGIGDLVIAGMYHVYDSDLFEKYSKRRYQLLLQTKVSIPTGSFNIPDDENEIEPHFQTGTGAINTQVVLSNIFHLNKDQTQIQAQFVYRHFSLNKYQFQFGRWFGASLNASHVFKISNNGLEPNLGIQFIRKEKDRMQLGEIGEASAFDLLSAIAGLSYLHKSSTFKLRYALPLYQQTETFGLRKDWHLNFAYVINLLNKDDK